MSCVDPPVINLDPHLIILYHQRENLLLSCVDLIVIGLDPLLIIPLSLEGRFTVVMCVSPGIWSRSTPYNPLYHQREDLLLSFVDPPVIDLDPLLIIPSIVKGKICCCHLCSDDQFDSFLLLCSCFETSMTIKKTQRKIDILDYYLIHTPSPNLIFKW